MTIKKFNELPELIQTNFNSMVIRINLSRNKMRLWESFSSREKKTLGGSYQNAIKTYKLWEMWQKFYEIPEPVCLIEVGYKLGLIDLATRDEFFMEINYKTKTTKTVKIINNLKFDAIYLNSLMDRKFTLAILILMYLRIINKRPILIAPRGECSIGALSITTFRKFFYVSVFQVFGLFKDLKWQASTLFEKNDIINLISFNITPLLLLIPKNE